MEDSSRFQVQIPRLSKNPKIVRLIWKMSSLCNLRTIYSDFHVRSVCSCPEMSPWVTNYTADAGVTDKSSAFAVVKRKSAAEAVYFFSAFGVG